MNDNFEKRMVGRVPEVVRYMDDDEKEKRKVVGYGAVFYREGDEGTEYRLFPNVRERIAPTAFDSALQRDDIRSLFNHDPNFVLGRQAAGTLRLSVDEIGLRYEVDLPESRKDVAEAISRGDVTGSSFWFRPTRESESKDGDGNTVYTIEDLELREVGPVTFPAYEATVSEMRSAKMNEARKRHIKKVVETEDSVSITFGKSEEWEGVESMNYHHDEEDKDKSERAEPDELSVGDFVEWDSSGGREKGLIERIERYGSIQVPYFDFTVNGTEDDPAALIEVYRQDGDGNEVASGVMVAHRFSTLSKIADPRRDQKLADDDLAESVF